MLRVDENMGIKVADFGLTRDIYQTDYYRQNHRSRVPIKWMAPESLYDRISNEKTDVVSSCPANRMMELKQLDDIVPRC